MSETIKYPICGKSFTGKPIKTWKFRFYDVKRFECRSCKTKFNDYESQNSRFTIPKAKTK
jgi:transposase-like protein